MTRVSRIRKAAAAAGVSVSCIVFAAAVAGVGASPGGDSASTHAKSPSSTSIAEPARFSPLPNGWTISDGGAATIQRSGANTWTLVTSWPYVANDYGPASVVPHDEFFISVLLIRRPTNEHRTHDLCAGVPASDDFPPIDPRDLSFASASRGRLEGYPLVTEYRIFGSVGNDYWVDIRVDVNSPQPDGKLIERAAAGLKRLVLPDWPNRC
jgi:hypothetical protein